MLRRASALLIAAATAAAAQSRTDVIKGRVTTDSGAVVAGAQVIVTMAPTRAVVQATGDASGNYEIKLDNGTGEYLLYISAVGRVAFRKRLTATGGDTTFVIDARLAAVAATTLAAVRSVASNARPPRTQGLDDPGRGVSGTDRSPEGVTGQVSPELAATLDAIAGSLPGFNSTPSGVSVFGMTGANLSTLNGLAMGVGDLPRDAKMGTRFQSSPYDPTKGGFAGAQMGFSFGSGGTYSYRRSHLTLDAPQLQATQANGRVLGQTNYNTMAGYGADGTIVPGKYFYNYAGEFRRSTIPVASLLDLDAGALAVNGVAADSARRLTQILAGQGIPVSAGGIPGDRTSTSASFIARIDRSAQPSKTPGGITTAPWWILATGSLRQSEAMSLSPVALPASTSKQQSGSVGLQGFASTYVGPARLWLNETMLAVTAASGRNDPYVTLPAGSVLVSSSLDDGTQSVRSLAFAGSSAGARRDESWSAELANSTTFYPASSTSKPVKLFLQGRYDDFDQNVGGQSLGTFTYASLADLAANQPSSFSRTVDATERRGGEYTGAAALALNWTLKKVNLVGGIRADGNSYTVHPEANQQVATTFGLATDHVPNTIALSPRLGFNWVYQGPSGSAGFNYMNGSTTGSAYRGPISLRGGVGRFRSTLAPMLISSALGTTGLPGSARQLTCFGADAPTPDWQAYAVSSAAVPMQCANGTPAFADTAPAVYGFDRRYGAMDSWRATLGTTRTIHDLTYVAVDGAYSLNLGQPSSYDLNFAGAPQLALSAEGNRPVYVPAQSIVAGTGTLSPVASRTSPNFSRVIERRSDMRSVSRQLIVHTIPYVKRYDPFVFVDYVYNDVRVKRRGFDAATAADPREAEWSPDAWTPRHQIFLQTGKGMKGLAVSVTTILSSGVRFTPMIASDINGDGLANDRAFVAPSDTALQRLIASGPSAARHCLASQLGSIAKQSSCVGAWTSSMNARVAWYKDVPGMGQRAKFSLNLSNPLAAADILLHGDNLRGWGARAIPDQTLLYARGFDAATKQFTYQVNPRFGATSPRTTAVLSPFRVTLDVQLNLGRDVTKQQVEINLRPPRGVSAERATEDTIKRRFIAAPGVDGPKDVYGLILYLKDSLALSRDQMARLEAARIPFRARIDTMYTELAHWLYTLPSSFDGAAAAARIKTVNTAAWGVMHDQGAVIQQIVTPAQLQLIWDPIRATLTRPLTAARWSSPSGGAWY